MTNRRHWMSAKFSTMLKLCYHTHMTLHTNLAKTAIETYIKTGQIIECPKDLPQEMCAQKAGVFVTIHNKNGDLRGCIGTFLPTQDNVAEETIQNAVSACSRDYRFSPITPAELPDLKYEVSILSEPEPAPDLTGQDPKKYGLIVRTKDGRCGLLLPDLDGVDTVEQQVDICCQKGGIDQTKDKLNFYRFTVEKYA